MNHAAMALLLRFYALAFVTRRSVKSILPP